MTNRRAAGEVLRGQLPSFYQHSGQDWSDYNALLVAEYSGEDFNQLLSLVEDTHRTLLVELEAIPAGELYRDLGLRAKGWIVTIARLMEAELKDEKEHYQQLKEFVEEGVKG